MNSRRTAGSVTRMQFSVWTSSGPSWEQAIAAARQDADARSSPDTIVSRLVESAPTALDLTDPETDALLTETADLLLDVLDDRSAFTQLDHNLASSTGPLPMRLATKLALSKQAVRGHPGPAFVSIVFAVYQEHHRIKTRDEHADGEDFLNRKLRQMGWLFDDRPDFGWELIVVDDGCPNGSGHLAQEIIERGGHTERARVLFLEEAIRQGIPVTSSLESAIVSPVNARWWGDRSDLDLGLGGEYNLT